MTRYLACCLLCLLPSLAYGAGDFEEGVEALLKKKDYDRAIACFSAAIRDNPKDAAAYRYRGHAHFKKKEYAKAIKDFTEAIRLDPKDAPAYTNLAWLLATCPKEEVRNGKKAVEYAKKACELTGWKEPNKLRVLAAAHAEDGQFKEAVEWEKRALGIGYEGKDDREQARKRLKLYEAGKPYRHE